MLPIPITFIHSGNHYSAELSPVIMGNKIAWFHLMIDGGYRGRLRYNQHLSANGWVFDTNDASKGWETLAEDFGAMVIAWVDSRAGDYAGLL